MTEENRATSLTQQTSVAQRLMQNRRDKELSIERKRKEHELQLRLEKEKAEILREENLENNERLERADIFKR
jgi:hypothetical protein